MSLALLQTHREVWRAKPALGQIYRVWFDALLRECPAGGRAFEVGAGPGFLRSHARETRADLEVFASDIEAAPWHDLVADCLRLPLRSASLDTIVGLDVIHHLAHPASFFAEAARVLPPGGRVAVIEPWVTVLSYPIYRWLHQEGCRLGLDPWDPFEADGTRSKDAFQGDGAVVWKMLRTTPATRWEAFGFHEPRVRVLNAFAYLLSLGFKKATLLPSPLVGPLLSVDDITRALAPWLGLRVFVVWERRRA
jgi:SAM-dependent methyltransferase